MATPMQVQYQELKEEYNECILLFRLGDFYEGFYEDAHTLSKVLGLTLTGRGKDDSRMDMAGIPHHALKQYLPKLVKAGYKVALAEQLNEPQPGVLVKRGVVKVITSGTVIDDNILTSPKNNYLGSFYYDTKLNKWGFSYADISTGEFRLSEFQGSNEIPYDLINELYKLRVSELIIPEDLISEVRVYFPRENISVIPNNEFDFTYAKRKLIKQFKVNNLKGFGIENKKSGVAAAGQLLKYLEYTQKTELSHLKSISFYSLNKYMQLDYSTIRSLEILYPMREFENGKSLFDVVNKCLTPMGQRLLQNWILRPLLEKDLVEKRLSIVSEYSKNIEALDKIREFLKGIKDIERISSRIATKNANARDLVFLKESLKNALELISYENKHFKNDECIFQKEKFDNVLEIIELIDKSILDEPSLSITEGGIIKKNYNRDLDELLSVSKTGNEYLKELRVREAKRTGISSLKINYNKVFGYYIEVSKANSSKVPEDYERKQTLVNSERYITKELKEWEDKILTSTEKSSQLEYEIFQEIRSKVTNKISEIDSVSKLIAKIDVLSNFTYLANTLNLVRPTFVDNHKAMNIEAGRHIVVEDNIGSEFIPNDLMFNMKNQQVIILTGPNMSGKSTYIRQIALIFLLAQIGSYVPAKSAQLHLIDRIFTRVGSGDNLAAGESTFMVEMNETANILNNASENSLLILDEVGRGTSTYDGLSLAWSIIEFIVKKIKAKTLFATHYHELMNLEDEFSVVKNYNVTVRENKGRILFMHNIERGGTDQSYGIHVAELAGIPKNVINRAEQLLKSFEEDSIDELPISSVDYNTQIPLPIETSDPIREDLKSININKMTPLEALEYLDKLKQDL